MRLSIFFFAQRNAFDTYVALIIYQAAKSFKQRRTELQHKTQWQGQIYPWSNSLISAELTQRWNRLTTCTWNTPVSSEGCSQILQPEGAVRITSSDFLQKQGEEISPISPLHRADGLRDYIPSLLAGSCLEVLWEDALCTLEVLRMLPLPRWQWGLCSLSSRCIGLCRGWRWRLRGLIAPSLGALPFVEGLCLGCSSLHWGAHRLRWEALRADWRVNSPVLGMKGSGRGRGGTWQWLALPS